MTKEQSNRVIAPTVKQLVGVKIKEYRKAANLSQEEFAFKIGLTRASIINIETGRHPNPKIPVERLLIQAVDFEYSSDFDDFDIVYRYQRANKDGKFNIRCKFGILSHSTLIKSIYEKYLDSTSILL